MREPMIPQLAQLLARYGLTHQPDEPPQPVVKKVAKKSAVSKKAAPKSTTRKRRATT